MVEEERFCGCVGCHINNILRCKIRLGQAPLSQSRIGLRAIESVERDGDGVVPDMKHFVVLHWCKLQAKIKKRPYSDQTGQGKGEQNVLFRRR